MSKREYIIWMSIIFLPFAFLVFPFYIGWMICDSFLDVIACKFKGGEE